MVLLFWVLFGLIFLVAPALGAYWLWAQRRQERAGWAAVQDHPEEYERVPCGNGWVLLDERVEEVGGSTEHSFLHDWATTSLGARDDESLGGAVHPWRAGRHRIKQPSPVGQETTYVLGWPKGQQTISEDDPRARPSAAANARQVTEGSVGQSSDADTSSQSDSPDVSDAESAPDGSDDPATSDVPDAPTAPSPPDEVGSY